MGVCIEICDSQSVYHIQGQNTRVILITLQHKFNTYNSIWHFNCILWFPKCLWVYVGFCSLNGPLWHCGSHFINLNTHAWRRMWCMDEGTAPGTCSGSQHFPAHKTCLQRACLAPDYDSPTLLPQLHCYKALSSRTCRFLHMLLQWGLVLLHAYMLWLH